MKIVVEWPRCDGNGLCVREAPELFALDDDDNLLVLQETFGPELQAKAERAVGACPKAALKISRED